MRAFCQGQIAHYKIPRHIRFVDEFPMTVTGKMQKFLMREQMIAELGLRMRETARRLLSRHSGRVAGASPEPRNTGLWNMASGLAAMPGAAE